ncbi:MAG: UDP-N-acetylmuramoyl-tripeptide--D-alanyl-D-alanine ligase [Rikenellaceae bacterium]
MNIEELYRLFECYPRISTDSRRVEDGSLFFALRGASFDGNRYAVAALSSGAQYSVVDDVSLLASVDEAVAQRLILVDDVLKTLQMLARYHRRELGCDILAITGSNGKTTTKELVRVALAAGGEVAATRGNFNNHIGVPLTLLSFAKGISMGIVEMGASSCGEIARLCEIAEPNYGVVTNVGRAHLEGFGGEQGVRRAKGELYDWLAANGGRAFVPSGDGVLTQMAGEREGLDVVWYGYDLADGVEHNLEGEYNRYNVATAVAIARYFGVEEQLFREAIGGWMPDNNRSQGVGTQRNWLLVDCYNANPSSMQVAIDNFVAQPLHGSCDGKVVVLGDMLELGEWSQAEHRAVVERVQQGGFAASYFVGSCFGEVFDGAFADRQSLGDYLDEHPVESKMILIKGSRGVGLEEIVKKL